MATYGNVSLLNSPNTNNNNNNHHPHHRVSSTLNHRDHNDYSTPQYQQPQQQHQDNYKSFTMPKTHYQNIGATPITPRDFTLTDQTPTYSIEPSPIDSELASSTSEPSKRLNHANGKFSIQKMFQGFSSWRSRNKPAKLSTTPPITSANTIYSNTPPPTQPPFSTGRYVTSSNGDQSPIPPPPPPPTAVRSISVDSISNRISSPQRIIVTEPVTHASVRASSVDSVAHEVDSRSSNVRTHIASLSTHPLSPVTSVPASTTHSITSTRDSLARPAPVAISRTLPVRFTETTRIVSPRSPPPPPPVTVVSSTMKTVDKNSNPSTITSAVPHPVRVPPPGMSLRRHCLSSDRLSLSLSLHPSRAQA